MTTAEACRLLGCKTEYQLAKRLGITPSAISQWGRMVPKRRREQVFLLAATQAFSKSLARTPF